MTSEEFIRQEFERMGVPQKKIDETIAAGRAKFGIIGGQMTEQDMAYIRGLMPLIHLLGMLEPKALKEFQDIAEQRMLRNMRQN